MTNNPPLSAGTGVSHREHHRPSENRLATSFCELVVFRSRPSSLPYWGVYLMYEFQKSVSERG
ncbi:hypothetical protein M2155_008065 [Streptomyces sp. SAI-119]|nr:hypothetical protein [Streptomyces sp. SAI-119]